MLIRILLFFLPFMLYADYLYKLYSHYFYVYNLTPLNSISYNAFCSTLEDNSGECQYNINGVYHYLKVGHLAYNGKEYITSYKSLDSGYNITCLLKNSTFLLDLLKGSLYQINFSSVDFCSNKSGYEYSSDSNAWIPSSNDGSEPLCPDGKIWSAANEKCVFDCSDENMKNLGSQKCGGENYIKSYSCSNDGNYSITCYTCSEIMNLADQFCKQNGYTLKDGLTCSAQNGKITTNVNFPNFDLSICNVPADNNDTNTSQNYNNDNNNSTPVLNDDNTSDNIALINSLDDLKNQLHNDNKDLKTALENINNNNKQGFEGLHSDLQGIDKKLNDINNSISVLGNVKKLTDDTSWLNNVKTDLTQGINKYKGYNFITTDGSTSDICLKDISFDLYGKTITLKVSEIANSVYVTIVKAVLWLAASLLIFFTCFRTD